EGGVVRLDVVVGAAQLGGDGGDVLEPVDAGDDEARVHAVGERVGGDPVGDAAPVQAAASCPGRAAVVGAVAGPGAVDAHGVDLAELAGGDELPQLVHPGAAAGLEADLHDAARGLRGPFEHRVVGERGHGRLLEVHVRARLEGLQREREVGVDRGGDHDHLRRGADVSGEQGGEVAMPDPL